MLMNAATDLGVDGGTGPSDGDIYDGGDDSEGEGEAEQSETSEQPETSESSEGEQSEQTPETPAVAEPPVPAKAPVNPAVALDDATIKKFAEALKPKQDPAPVAKKLEEKSWDELTPQEYNQRTNRVVVTPDTLANFGILDASPEQVTAFQGFADGVARNALTMANEVIKQHLGSFDQKYSKIHEAYTSHETSQAYEQFYSEYPHLKGKDELLKVVTKNISPTKPDGSTKSMKELFTEINSVATQVLKSAGVNTSQVPVTPGKSSVPKPNQMITPGRSSQQQHQQPRTPSDADIYN